MNIPTKKIAVISLGCDKNRVDTEKMLSCLSSGDYVIAAEEEAEIIIVNTCAFIEDARREAIETILGAALRKRDKCEKLIVTGCLPQKYLGELKDSLPEVDAFLGINDYPRIREIIAGLYGLAAPADCKAADEIVGRVLTTPPVYAYLKAADGCDNHCTYCTIPGIRGSYRSRSIESLVAEASELRDMGVKEFILVAQDLTNYGADLYGAPKLVELIRALSPVADAIRLMYCYPTAIDDRLIAEIRDNEKVLKYLDIPVQHSEDRILKLMGRRHNGADIRQLITKLRQQIPGIAVRTTFMVGFPTETDEEFEALCRFVEEYKPEHAGVFSYSPEKDTASYKLPDRVKKSISAARRKKLYALLTQNAKDFNQAAVGKTFRVMYEGIDFDKNLFYGRAYFSAPDVDTLVYFKGNFADLGEYYNVKITGYKGFDLIGEIE